MPIIKKRRRVVARNNNDSPARRVVRRITRAVVAQQESSAVRKKAADLQMKTAVAKALTAVTPDELAAIRANPKLARKVNEEAAVRAAAKYGINIRKPNGKLDMRLARKAAETAAIQTAAEMGFNITNKRGGISRRKALEAARAADSARAGGPVNAQVKAAVERQDARLASAARAAGQRGLSTDQLRIAELQADPSLAQKAAREAVIQEAAASGVNIFKADGSLDERLARQVADGMAIRSAAELGFNITDSAGKLSRRKALEAARAADAARSVDAARAGKPASAQLKAAVTRQDARMLAALQAAERKENPAPASPSATRRQAHDDAELAALVRRSFQEKIR